MHPTHKLYNALIMVHTQTQTSKGWIQTFVIPSCSVKVLQIVTQDKMGDLKMSCLSCLFNRKCFKNGKSYGMIDRDTFDIS